jgi:hypothetical protein
VLAGAQKAASATMAQRLLEQVAAEVGGGDLSYRARTSA